MTGLCNFFGPANEDRLHQIGFSFLADLPWGFRFNVATKINSPLASSMFLPLTTGGADEIFYSDLDGDGVTESESFPVRNPRELLKQARTRR